MNHYECMFVLHNREVPEEEQPAAEPEQVIAALVEKVGGTIAHSLVWANRKLAYSIKGNQTATYVLAYVTGDAAIVSALQHAVAIHDRVLRMMAFAIDEVPAADAIPGPLAEPAGRGGRRDAEPEPEPEIAEGERRPTRDEREKARMERLDYKNVYHLRRMVTAQGKLFSRVRSGMSAKEQRHLRAAVLRARNLALLPFVAR